VAKLATVTTAGAMALILGAAAALGEVPMPEAHTLVEGGNLGLVIFLLRTILQERKENKAHHSAPVLDAVNGLRSDVNGVHSRIDHLTDRIDGLYERL